MADTFQLEIVTPERLLVSESVSEMEIPGKGGYLGILPGHAPLISELSVGEISYRDSKSQVKRLAVAWGFVEVLPDKVTILAETAERAEDIDVARARAAREKAEAILKSPPENADTAKAEASLQVANARIAVAEKLNSQAANLVP
jgi:F-type H+-transporting ATPase subunit epsilon